MIYIKKIIILLLLLLTISAVSAGNNTTTVDNPTEYYSDLDTVTALESGDSNISFSDGYKGYCIEWGEHSAEQGDKYYIQDHFVIINKETGEDVSNHIKIFFVYFYNESQKNPIVTQHIIWKFTDNKEFSQFRANKELYYAILNKSATTTVPDKGYIQINNTTKMVFDFKVFLAKVVEYQNYFGYNIFFENITYTTNETTNITNNTSNNQTNIKNNNTIYNPIAKNITTSTSTYTKLDENSKKCGYEIWSLLCAIFLMVLIICLKRKED